MQSLEGQLREEEEVRMDERRKEFKWLREEGVPTAEGIRSSNGVRNVENDVFTIF